MSVALDQYELFGVRNNVGLCLRIVTHPKFIAGEFNTDFLFSDNQVLDDLKNVPDEILDAASVIAVLRTEVPRMEILKYPNGIPRSKWRSKRFDFHR